MPLVNAGAKSPSSQKAPPTTSEAHGAGEEGSAKTLASLVEDMASNPHDEVMRLRNKSKELRAEKKSITRNLRNAQRRTTRMQKRAKNLSDADLLSVLRMRQVKQSQKVVKSKANKDKVLTARVEEDDMQEDSESEVEEVPEEESPPKRRKVDIFNATAASSNCGDEGVPALY